MRERGAALSGGGVPQSGSVVSTSGGDGLAVRAEGEAVDPALVRERGAALSGGGVPQGGGVVPTGGCDGFAIGAEGDSGDPG
jgi:hypothetical protein